MFFGIVSAVKSLQRQIPRTHQQYESPLKTFLKSQKSSRIAYKQLIANKSEKPISCIDKWHKDIHSSTDKNADWRNVFLSSKHLYNELKTNSVGCLWHSHGKNPVRLYPKLQSQPIGLPKIFIDYFFFQVDQWDCTKPLSICDRFASSDCTPNCKASQ